MRGEPRAIGAVLRRAWPWEVEPTFVACAGCNRKYLTLGADALCPDCEARKRHDEEVRHMQAERARRRERIETPAGEAEAEIPAQYHGAAFEDCPEHAEALAAWYRSGPGLLFLWGPCGTGKTRCLYALRRRAWVDGVSVLGGAAADIVRQATAQIVDSARAEGEYLRRLAEHRGVVVLDDLGASRLTEYAVSVLGGLVSAREEYDRALAVASNLELDKIAALLGDRTASRLAGGLVLHFDGPDRRLARGRGAAR